MKIPIEEVDNYLNTPEMLEVIQGYLNDDSNTPSTHIIDDIEIIPYHDKELQVSWEFIREGIIITDGVSTENLERDLKGFL